MVLIKPSFEVITKIDYIKALKAIELIGRVCYKSEAKITNESCVNFVKKVIGSGHESVIEHVSISVRIICDRGISHEIVRHRIASYSQESTRYCNYKGGVQFIIPPWVNIEPGEYESDKHPFEEAPFDSNPNHIFLYQCKAAEYYYIQLLNNGWTPQMARSVLPNSLKTEIIATMNLREWRHFFELRTARTAHPQMREISIPMLNEFKATMPAFFDDLEAL